MSPVAADAGGALGGPEGGPTVGASTDEDGEAEAELAGWDEGDAAAEQAASAVARIATDATRKSDSIRVAQ
jgi:hypothetical protein